MCFSQHIRTHSVFVSGGTSPPNAWDRLGGRLAAVGKLAMSARANGAGAAARAGGEALPWCHLMLVVRTYVDRPAGPAQTDGARGPDARRVAAGR